MFKFFALTVMYAELRILRNRESANPIDYRRDSYRLPPRLRSTTATTPIDHRAARGYSDLKFLTGLASAARIA
jgi:hypothetical protein